jgi:CubicO group peptidase (beta-lactamase class C family)
MFAPSVATCAARAKSCSWSSLQQHYTYGWFTGTIAGHQVLNHGGDAPGYTTMNTLMPNDGISIVLLSNQADSGASTFLGLALAQIMLGQAS